MQILTLLSGGSSPVIDFHSTFLPPRSNWTGQHALQCKIPSGMVWSDQGLHYWTLVPLCVQRNFVLYQPDTTNVTKTVKHNITFSKYRVFVNITHVVLHPLLLNQKRIYEWANKSSNSGEEDDWPLRGGGLEDWTREGDEQPDVEATSNHESAYDAGQDADSRDGTVCSWNELQNSYETQDWLERKPTHLLTVWKMCNVASLMLTFCPSHKVTVLFSLYCELLIGGLKPVEVQEIILYFRRHRVDFALVF